MNQATQKVMKAHICVCTWRDLDVPTALMLNRITRYPNPKFTMSIGSGDALISRMRSVYATKFLMNPGLGEVLLFVDSDIVFQPQDAIQLVSMCDKEHRIIGGFYATRSSDQPKPAVRLKPATHLDGTSVDPVEIVYASTGFMAIHRSVLEEMAKTLPLCQPASGDAMYPFFQPFAFNHSESKIDSGHGWEYLSEDWAFCEKARQMGEKIYLAPSVRVGHFGMRTYWVNDILQKSRDTTYAVVSEGSSSQSAMISDLAGYHQLDPRDVAHSLDDRDPMSELVAEWNNASPKTIEEISNFWQNSGAAIDAFATHCAEERYRNRLQPALQIAFSAEDNILDLGSPLGSFTVEAKKLGAWPIFVEPTNQLRNYAIACLNSRRYSAPVLGSLDQLQSMFGPHFMVKTMVAAYCLSLSHPQRSRELVEYAASHLAPGGQMIIASAADEGWPFCLTSDREIGEMMVKNGFQGGPIQWTKQIT